MKDIITIIVRLTVSCLLAATVMGVCFIFTSNAKKHNEHIKEQQVMYALLGYEPGSQIPESLALHEVYRYVISSPEKQSIGYLVPQGLLAEGQFLFVNIDLTGELIETKPIPLSEKDALARELVESLLAYSLGRTIEFSDADAIEAILHELKREDYPVRSMIHAVTASRLFHTK